MGMIVSKMHQIRRGIISDILSGLESYIMSRSYSKRQLQSPNKAIEEQAIFEEPSSRMSGEQSGQSQSGPDPMKHNNNSLRQLTSKFVDLICKAKDCKIELQQAAGDLKVQKRRIYDITNVLEGIGYVEKLGKNVMKWVGGQTNEELEKEALQLEGERKKLEEEGRKLERDIEELKGELKASSLRNAGECYLNEEDMISIMEQYGVVSLLIYEGVENDSMYDNECPENAINQFNIESTLDSTHKNTTLHHCQLQSHRLQVTTHHPPPLHSFKEELPPIQQ